jgi:hypothetical protein
MAVHINHVYAILSKSDFFLDFFEKIIYLVIYDANRFNISYINFQADKRRAYREERMDVGGAGGTRAICSGGMGWLCGACVAAG